LNKRAVRNNDGGEQSGKISQESPKRESSTQLAQDVISGTPTKKKPICQVIADSDDEHTADLEAHEGFDKPAFVLGDDNLYPSLSKLAEDTNGITRDSPVKATKNSPKKTPRTLSNQSPQKSLIKSPKPRPQVEGLLTSLAPYPSSSRNFVERAKSAENSPAPTPATTQKVRDDQVVKFLALPDNVFEGVLAKLLQERKANAEVVYQHAIEGEIAPAHLITQNRNLGVRINAFKDLESERDTYRKTFIRKEELKKLVIQAIEQGDGLDTIPEVVKESQSAEKQLRDTETRILDQLIIAKPGFIDEGSFDNQIEREIKPPAEYSAILERTAVSSVRQSSPARAVSRACSPRKLLFPTTIDTNIQRSSEQNVLAQTFEQRSILTAGDSAPFVRNMDPLLSDPNDTDEFGIDDDDDDFIEAADDRRFDQENYYNSNRKILAETSGNVSHAAATSQKYLTSEQAAIMCHPWSKDVKTVMKERFRLRGFRSNQLEAINATLSGKDAFVLMPTGGGKSLCYQLPAIVRSGRTKGVTLVVSPLLSLMQDQVAHLQDLHIKAFLINGEVSAQQKRWVTQTLASRNNDEIEILYITPEMINLNQTLRNSLESLHKNGNLARIVIDEAHCVSQWGHDFRPDYKELGTVRSRFPGVPVMALTATATQNVRVDVIHNLGMKGCEVFTQSFNRPNLTYEVLPKKGSMKEVTQRIVSIIKKSYQNKMGIVYCLSRNDCEKVSSHLCEFGVASKHYHAGMKPDERTQVQQQWQASDFQVIVATIAFGMGIDKPDVRFVMHFSIPKSLEGYYQETGRAGRDGKRSGCYLFYGYRDSAVQKRLLESGDGSWAQKERQRQMLRNLVQFCENRTDCRRVQVLAYFNESFRREDCHRTCDNCKSDASFELQDFTSYAKRAIELVGDFDDRGEKTTLLHCVDIFAGHSKKSFPPEHKAHRLFGAGRGLELGEVERLFFRLLMEEALYEETKMFKSFATNYIKKGRKAEEYLHGRRSMQLPIRMSPNGKKRSNPSSRTGVYAAVEDHPQSTLLSSPIQSASRRKQARRKVDKMKDVQISSDDEDSDGFERLRIAGKPTRRKTNAPGPPIIGDHVMEELDDLHLIVVEDFMTHATAECNEVSQLLHWTTHLL
jgi:bloom syndrome protein